MKTTPSPARGFRGFHRRWLLGLLIVMTAAGLITLPVQRRLWREAERERQRRLEIEQRLSSTQRAYAFESERLRLLQRLSEQPADAQTMLRLASLYGQARRYDDALFMLHAASRSAPQLAEPHRAAGEIYEDLRFLDKAIVAYRQAIAADPKDVTSRLRLAYAYISLGWSVKARELLKEAQKLEPQNPGVYIAAGLLENQYANFSAAAENLEKARRLDPENPAVYAGLADVYNNLTQSAKAIQFIQRALALDPDRTVYQLQFARLLLDRKQDDDLKEAENIYKKILSSNSDDVEALYGLGMCYRDQGRGQDAMEALEKVWKAAPSHRTVALDLGQLYLRHGRRAEGQRLLKAYNDRIKEYTERKSLNFRVAMQPDDLQGHVELARVHRDAGEIPRAIVEYKRALELHPDNREVRRQLAAILRRVGRDEEARQVERGEISGL